VRYLMTPTGWEALGSATRASIENTIHLYTETREQIRRSLGILSQRCAIHPTGEKRVVFFGAGDVAEIAYVSLQRTDLTLIGVVDDRRSGRFFEVAISSPEVLSVHGLNGVAYSHVIVATVRHTETIQARVTQRGIPPDRVFCL
jgi:predicted alpha/beta-fold hydrolase